MIVRSTGAAVSALAVCLLAAGCTALPTGSASASGSGSGSRERALMDRTHYLEREVARLRADLAQAEAAIGAAESGKQGAPTRAHAVSALAEARLAVRRAGRAAPWRADDLAEARDSLARAEARFGAGRSASALFFASRARRIADELEDDAARLAASPEARLVTRARANLRKGPSQADVVLDVLPKATPVVPERRQSSWIQIRTPSGQLGWVHGSLVKAR